MKSLVIVESPAKAKTIGKYLGKDYVVKASLGHIKDLPKKTLGVQITKNFEPQYKIIPGKEKVVQELKAAAKGVSAVYLAADPDREGEAICQHLAEELRGNRKKIYRVLFNEITKSSVTQAFEHPASVDTNKVEAQQARRILDRLVGYKISPLLWEKVRRGLSAGRVQTVALRMIIDREREIRAFVSEEYWTITANLSAKNPPPFDAKAVKLDGEKFKVTNEQTALALVEELKKADFIVDKVAKKEKKVSAPPPFITSKLQQEAGRKLKFPVKKTMMIAQKLYEGIELGEEGSVGLITYMRTDSPRVSDQALREVREFIDQKHGADYLPEKPIYYKGRKQAQEAHEAIRPTAVWRTPESLEKQLSRDEFRLYALIWKRFVASQMNPAIFNQTEIEIKAGRCLFKAVGSVPLFKGFLSVYEESREEDTRDEDEAAVSLPDVSVGERLKLNKLTPKQNFTQPPPRYTEAMLVKGLEEKGIGRPSTYATILSTLQNREYVTKQEGRFVPSETGEVVVDLLVGSFQDMFDYDYTARMEDHLDKIEEGEEHWVDAMKNFWDRFSKKLDVAEKEMPDLKREEIQTDEICDKCGSKMVIKWGRFGRFIACSAYPECKNTRELPNKENLEQRTLPEIEGKVCDKCGRPMVLKKGRYGEFLACSGYPECKTTIKLVTQGQKVELKEDIVLDEKCPECGEPLVIKHGRFGEFTACRRYPECKYIKLKTTGVKCPNDGGDIVERKSRRGKVFYGCANYPSCNFVLWYKPIPEPCPKCGRHYVIERYTKKKGLIRYCDNENCDYEEPIVESNALVT